MPTSSRPPPGDRPSSALLDFMEAYVRFGIDDVNALLKERELSMPQLGALHFLRAEGPQSVSGVAEHLNLSRTATSFLVDRLVRKALVERGEDPADRRQKRVALAGAGRELLAEVRVRSAATLEALLGDVPDETRAALERAVQDVVAALERSRAATASPEDAR